MTLQQLRYFLAACRHESFAAAAKSLYIAQPSLAEQIRRLEQELGVRLFVRTGRRLKLTDAGSKLQFGAQRVLAEVDASIAAVRETVDLRSGTASLGTFGLAHCYLIREVVTAFAARYPDVAVRVVGQNSHEVIGKVRDGELEAGLVSLPVDEPTLVVEPFVADEILYAALPSSDTAQPMSIERLAQTRLITYTAVLGWHDSIRRLLWEWAADAGVELSAPIEVEFLESALELAGQGLGGTYVPRAITPAILAGSSLVTVAFERPLFDTYAFIRRADHKLSPATAELISLVRSHLEGSLRLDPSVPR